MLQIDEEGRRIREIVPMEGMRAAIAEKMAVSKREYPQGTGSVELEVSKLIQFRKELKAKGVDVTFGDLYVKVCACAVEENMAVNASRADGKITYYDDININVMATINGYLMQPVIERADTKDIEEISEELHKTYEYLRKGRLMKVKLEGGTIACNNLGSYMIDDIHPFLYPPQAAHFGVSRNKVVPVFNEQGEVVPGNMTLFSLTIDHGALDGVEVAKFLTTVNKVVQDPWTYLYHKAEPRS